MSRTFNTDPFWVRCRRDGHIEHDHSFDRCVEESPSQPLYGTRSYSGFVSHDCPRRKLVKRECGTRRGYSCYDAYAIRRNAMLNDLPVPIGCGKFHEVITYDTSIHCSRCDAMPEFPTCTYVPSQAYGWSYRYGAFGGPTAYFCRVQTHVPNRVRQRAVLGNARKEFNAGVRDDCGCVGFCDCEGFDSVGDAWDCPAFTKANSNVWWD